MAATHLIAARVSPETKSRFRALAEQHQVTESALLKQLVERAVLSVGQSDAEVLRPSHRALRGSRVSVRLHPDDQLLLSERAAARQMAVATYVSVLVRSHLRSLSPLPKEELMCLKRSVADVGLLRRHINQLVQLILQGRNPAGPSVENLKLIIQVCDVTCRRIKDLIKANARSWENGHANTPS